MVCKCDRTLEFLQPLFSLVSFFCQLYYSGESVCMMMCRHGTPWFDSLTELLKSLVWGMGPFCAEGHLTFAQRILYLLSTDVCSHISPPARGWWWWVGITGTVHWNVKHRQPLRGWQAAPLLNRDCVVQQPRLSPPQQLAATTTNHFVSQVSLVYLFLFVLFLTASSVCRPWLWQDTWDILPCSWLAASVSDSQSAYQCVWYTLCVATLQTVMIE